jgi:acyl-CoA thioester hydrolase
MSRRFRYYLRVRYQECDAQHVVFNARYGDYIDLACFEFLRAALPRPDRRFDGTFEIQTVRQVIEWKAPARFDDVLEISMWASRSAPPRSRSAASCAGPARPSPDRHDRDGLRARRCKTFTKREIAPEMRAALEAGAAGKPPITPGICARHPEVRSASRRSNRLAPRVHHAFCFLSYVE